MKFERGFMFRGAITLLFSFALLSAPIVRAEEEGGCSSCSGGGGGSGGGAAEVLFGLAAIMAAVAPIAAAAIQADADKDIARVNRDGQIAMTNISADTSKYLATQQKEIALEQAGIAQEISQENQQAATERLEMQLSALEKARNEAAAVEAQKRAYQEKLDNDRIALAKEQAAAAKELADVQFRAQLTAAGMSDGFAGTQNSATGQGLSRSVASVATPASGMSYLPPGFSGTGVAATATQTTAVSGASRAAKYDPMADSKDENEAKKKGNTASAKAQSPRASLLRGLKKKPGGGAEVWGLKGP